MRSTDNGLSAANRRLSNTEFSLSPASSQPAPVARRPPLRHRRPSPGTRPSSAIARASPQGGIRCSATSSSALSPSRRSPAESALAESLAKIERSASPLGRDDAAALAVRREGRAFHGVGSGSDADRSLARDSSNGSSPTGAEPAAELRLRRAGSRVRRAQSSARRGVLLSRAISSTAINVSTI